jgi:hypothetical protein
MKCGYEEESSSHILCQRTVLAGYRIKIFSSALIEQTDNSSASCQTDSGLSTVDRALFKGHSEN